MTEGVILDGIKSPDDIKKLSADELNELSDEIRKKIINVVSDNGGHLASNLGVVELTIALHTVFELPEDNIVWDVGHQCYAHKILTGRCSKIGTIRKENGLSGFPKREESKYDSFNTGHSSTSVSAAYGISCAKSLRGKNYEKSYTVAVIGDGALSGGLALEGLNNAGRSGKRLIIVLNDNDMSISKNVGAMAKHLTKIRIRPAYINAKDRVHSNLDRMPSLGKPISSVMRKVKNWIRDTFFRRNYNMFEQLGFTYYGPLDGHDIQQLQSAFRAAKRCLNPVVVHICTKKGKGYSYAEDKPGKYHGVSPFDIETGDTGGHKKDYSDVFGEYICSAAKNDKRICAITAAMAIGTGLSEFSEKYKERFYDVGIAEEHAVTFAAGLAAGNAIPVFAVYSTFLQRSYDQILHDAALQKLHIVLAVDRAGIVGQDGETHQGIFDVSFLNTIPDVTIFSPSSFDELRKMLEIALYKTNSAVAVRYPRGSELYVPDDYKYDGEDYSFYGRKNSDILIVTYGRLFSFACEAKEMLFEKGIEVCILKLNKIKPIDLNSVKKALHYKKVYFFEEGISDGGTGQKFGFMLYQSGFSGKYFLTAIDGYVKQAETESALHKLGLDSQSMVQKIFQEENFIDGRKKAT